MNNSHERAGFRRVAGVALLWILSLGTVAVITDALYAQYDRAVTTAQYDNARTGWNRDETTLTVDNVNPDMFGKKWTAPLDGQIYGAPLYVSGVVIGGQSRKVVYVATENNMIYALDAETGSPRWSSPYFLGTPGLAVNLTCPSISPNVGITGTMTIDLETDTLYAVGLTCQDTPCAAGSRQIYKMAALDLATGESRVGWPVTIDPVTDPRLNTQATLTRGALLLANGRVYVPFGGNSCDSGPYHGWVIGLDKVDPKAPPIFYRALGDDVHRGIPIWTYGGVAADADGNIYAATGNSFNAPGVDYSNAVIRLTPDLAFSGDTKDFFMPSNWVNLNTRDWDLGSSTAVLLPSQEGSKTPNLIFVAGKYGVGHLIDRDNMGGVAGGDGVRGEGVYSGPVFTQPTLPAAGAVFASAVYYEDPERGPMMFLAGRNTQPDFGVSSTVLAMGLTVDDLGNSAYEPLWVTPNLTTPMTPVVTSASGEVGILWTVGRTRGALSAFNASTGDLLYDTSMVPGDELGVTRNFLHFTAIDGKVFVANAQDQLVAYGLR